MMSDIGTLEVATLVVCCHNHTHQHSLLLKIHLLCASSLLLTYLSTFNFIFSSLSIFLASRRDILTVL